MNSVDGWVCSQSNPSARWRCAQPWSVPGGSGHPGRLDGLMLSRKLSIYSDLWPLWPPHSDTFPHHWTLNRRSARVRGSPWCVSVLMLLLAEVTSSCVCQSDWLASITSWTLKDQQPDGLVSHWQFHLSARWWCSQWLTTNIWQTTNCHLFTIISASDRLNYHHQWIHVDSRMNLQNKGHWLAKVVNCPISMSRSSQPWFMKSAKTKKSDMVDIKHTRNITMQYLSIRYKTYMQ